MWFTIAPTPVDCKARARRVSSRNARLGRSDSTAGTCPLGIGRTLTHTRGKLKLRVMLNRCVGTTRTHLGRRGLIEDLAMAFRRSCLPSGRRIANVDMEDLQSLLGRSST